MICQRLCTTHDRNGNPRRLWAIYTRGGLYYNIIREDYSRPVETEGMVTLPTLDITPKEYLGLLKIFPEKNK